MCDANDRWKTTDGPAALSFEGGGGGGDLNGTQQESTFMYGRYFILEGGL